jgi:hypothetical protein
VQKYQTVEQLLKVAYPTHEWDHAKFVNTRLSPQKFLFRIIKSIFGSSGTLFLYLSSFIPISYCFVFFSFSFATQEGE